MKNNPLENYLATVDKIIAVLPSVRRENERNELCQHLEEMIANRVISGESETEATVNALQQFGDARTVGMGLRTAYFRTAWRSTPAGTLLIALLLQFASIKVAGAYAEHFLMSSNHPSPTPPAAYYGYLLLFTVFGASIGGITAAYAPVRRALATTTLMQILACALMFSGLITAGAHFIGINLATFVFQFPEQSNTVGILPIQQGIALLCGWIAALCVGQYRRHKIAIA